MLHNYLNEKNCYHQKEDIHSIKAEKSNLLVSPSYKIYTKVYDSP